MALNLKYIIKELILHVTNCEYSIKYATIVTVKEMCSPLFTHGPSYTHPCQTVHIMQKNTC